MLKPDLLTLACMHGIQTPTASSRTVVNLKAVITEHLFPGDCLTKHNQSFEGCALIYFQYSEPTSCTPLSSCAELQIDLLSSLPRSMTRASLRRLLTLYNIEFLSTDGAPKLRRRVKKYVTTLKKGKFSEAFLESSFQSRQANRLQKDMETNARRKSIADSWPQMVSPSLKDKLLNLLQELCRTIGEIIDSIDHMRKAARKHGIRTNRPLSHTFENLKVFIPLW